MPITTLDPFGRGSIQEFNVTIRPNPVDADVRIWVQGIEQPVTKKVGFHITNETSNSSIVFRVNQTAIEPSYGYIGYDDYYYYDVNVGDAIEYIISQPGYTTYSEAFAVSANSMKQITLVENNA